jgi:DNA-binding NarL/FixJ family response regulator
MIRAYIADPLPQERSALRLLLLDLDMEVVCEASDWLTILRTARSSKMNMLLIDWNILPDDSRTAIASLRATCPAPIVVVLISQLDARQQAARSSGADAFISKNESPDRVAERLQLAAKSIPN